MRSLSTDGIAQVARVLAPAVALAIGLSGLASQPARAQLFNWGGDGASWGGGGWGGGYAPLGPGEIYRAIGQQGFRVIAPLRRNGSVFVVEVVDRRGRRERLIVAAADAQILQRFILRDQGMRRDAGSEQGDDLERQMQQVDRGDEAPPVPPGSIPNPGNPNRIYGYGDDNAVTEPVRPRAPKVLRQPKPRLVDRTPDVVQPDRDLGDSQPARIRARPSEPLRLPSAPAAVADRPVELAPSVTASRPVELLAKPSAPTPALAAPAAPVATASAPPDAPASAPPSARMRDPLAIPKPAAATTASAANPSPRRVTPGTVTGAPATELSSPKPAAPAKTGDVPAAPLD